MSQDVCPLHAGQDAVERDDKPACDCRQQVVNGMVSLGTVPEGEPGTPPLIALLQSYHFGYGQMHVQKRYTIISDSPQPMSVSKYCVRYGMSPISREGHYALRLWVA